MENYFTNRNRKCKYRCKYNFISGKCANYILKNKLGKEVE